MRGSRLRNARITPGRHWSEFDPSIPDVSSIISLEKKPWAALGLRFRTHRLRLNFLPLCWVLMTTDFGFLGTMLAVKILS